MALFSAKTGLDRREKEKKSLVPNFVYTRPGEENSEKNSKKIQKSKNLFLALFIARTG